MVYLLARGGFRDFVLPESYRQHCLEIIRRGRISFPFTLRTLRVGTIGASWWSGLLRDNIALGDPPLIGTVDEEGTIYAYPVDWSAEGVPVPDDRIAVALAKRDQRTGQRSTFPIRSMPGISSSCSR